MIGLKRRPTIRSRVRRNTLPGRRLWPRGVSKAKLHLDAGLKHVGPSAELDMTTMRIGVVTIALSMVWGLVLADGSTQRPGHGQKMQGSE